MCEQEANWISRGPKLNGLRLSGQSNRQQIRSCLKCCWHRDIIRNRQEGTFTVREIDHSFQGMLNVRRANQRVGRLEIRLDRKRLWKVPR